MLERLIAPIFFGVLRGLERPSTRLKLTRTRYTFSLIKEQVPGPKFGSEDASLCVWYGLSFSEARPAIYEGVSLPVKYQYVT